MPFPPVSLSSLFLQKSNTKICHVYIGGPWQKINTTGYVTPENELRWVRLTSVRHQELLMGLARVLNVLQTYQCQVEVSTNSNGMNYITFDLSMTLFAKWPAYKQSFTALKDLIKFFDVNFIFDEELIRYCFDKEDNGFLSNVVEIDDGGC